MKTIKVSDEMYEKLIELATEMTTQDMRITQMPHMFQVRENKEVAAYDGCGQDIWVNNEGNTLRSEDEKREYVINHIYENDDDFVDLDDNKADIASKKKGNKMDEWGLDDYLQEEINEDWRRVQVTTEPRYSNTFFTAKACQEHIDSNDYHYTEPTVYLNHAWRNPEMELVSEFLCNLVGKSNHK